MSICRIVANTGQSNALTYGTRDVPYIGGWEPTNHILGYDPATNTCATYNPNAPSGDGHSYWGPSASFCRKWLDDNPNDYLCIVKVTLLSNGISPATPPNWAPYNHPGSTWASFIMHMRLAELFLSALGFEPIWDTWLHIQGENDGTAWTTWNAPGVALLYEHNTRNMTEASRAALKAPFVRIVHGRIFPLWDPSQIVRKAIVNLGGDFLAAWVDMDDSTYIDGGGHMDAASVKRIGERMYSARWGL